MRTKLKLVLVLASLGALAALAMAGTASAGAPNLFQAGDPMEANIPYVAWAGEEVRLVKCIDDPRGEWEGSQAEWAIVDSSVRQRSGELRDPVFFDDTDRRTPDFAGGGEQRGRTCWAIDVDSVNPGMTRIKMAVDARERVQGSPELKHDFLVVWLNMSAPVLTELSDAAFPGFAVGDPLGDGNFTASGTPGAFRDGLIRARVTGSFTDLHGGLRTLPADWASLAGRYAFDVDGYNPMAWDIHDDDLATEGHTATSLCAGVAAIDAVDNCLGGGLGEVGRFSRIIGGTGQLFGETVGPFDPARPDSSFLPDGKLDFGDAPMPAARIDVDLAGSVGALAAADKHVLYSRNRNGSSAAHNLYAPFYAAAIPGDWSQIRPGFTSSGTTGPIANNFPGYQTLGILNQGVRGYHYWDLLLTHERGGVNACRDVGGTGQFGQGEFIPRPTGIDAATVYTDEHGEAILRFRPDVGAVLAPDANGRCDLGEVGAPALLGTATIRAEALDPYQLTFNDPRLSNTLTKNVFERAGKSLDCVPKTPIEAFCVEVIRDIRGNPVSGALVSFTREPRGLMIPAALNFGGYNTIGQVVVSATDDEIRIRTNALGQAGIEVKSTQPGLVDVDAENVATRNGGFGVQRVRCLRFAGNGTTLPTDGPTCAAPTDGGTPIPPTSPTPTAPPVTGNSGNSGNSPATTATVVSLAGNPVPAAVAPEAKKPTAKAAALKLTSARLVFQNGKRYLVVRVNGSAKSAKVRITLVMRTGKATKPVVRTIKTNAAVRVANLQVSKHVRTVRVALAR